MFCKNCGTQNPDTNAFCISCGSPLTQQHQNQNQQYNQAPYGQPQYGQAQYNYAPYGGYKAPIQSRGIAMCIILSIITCGIYGIIWMIALVDDLNTASQRQGDTNGITVFLLTLVTCGIYGWVWMYKAGEKVDAIKTLNGQPSSNSGLIYLLLSLFGLSIVSYCLIQSELNNVASLA